MEWNWDFGDGTTADTQNSVVTYELPGTYGIALTVTGSGGTDTSSECVIEVLPRAPECTSWEKLYGGDDSEFSCGIAATPDGGYIIVATALMEQEQRLLLLKIDQDGQEEWNRSYFQGFRAFAFSVLPLPDGDYVILSGIVDRSRKGIWLMRTDSQGVVLWESEQWGRSAYRQSLIQTSDGGLVIAGTEAHETSYTFMGSVTAYMQEDIWLARAGTDGVFEWERTFAGDGVGKFGGELDDQVLAVAETREGDLVMLCASTIYDLDQDSTQTNLWLIRTDSIGNMIQETTLQVSGAAADDALNRIRANRDGNSFFVHAELTASGMSGNLGRYIQILRVDLDGNELWSTSLGHGTELRHGAMTRQTSDGGYIFIGSSVDISLIKIDSHGAIQWEESFGSGWNDTGDSVLILGEDEYIILGTWNVQVKSDIALMHHCRE